VTRDLVAKRVHWSFIIWLAGMINVTAMLPQLVRIIRTRNIEGLSRAMVVLYFLVQVAFSIERVVRVMTMLGFCSRRLWLAVRLNKGSQAASDSMRSVLRQTSVSVRTC
jgi:uncharacterized protein with PQ loop repeat